MAISERFNLLRKYLNLNQKQMAEALGITQPSISAIEKTGSVSVETIEKISNTYNNISIEWLITGNGSMIKSEPVINDDIIAHLKREILERDKKISELNDRIIELLGRL